MIDFKKLNHQDIEEFVELIRVFEEVFEMENFTIPDNEHLLKVLARPDFITMVAITEKLVIGGLTAYVLHQYYSKKPIAYIYDLAVMKNFQRQGIGKRLINSFLKYCHENNYEEVFVQAYKVDDYAIDFYRSTGITEEEQVVHFTYSLSKDLPCQ